MSVAPEIELKLEFEPGDRAAIAAAALFEDVVPREDHLVSTYFDTPAMNIRDAGYSLRVRRNGREHIQTIKADKGTAAGLFTRSEWERPVKGNVPIIDPDADPLPSAVGDSVLDTTGKIFVTDVERLTLTLHRGDSVVECAIDVGKVRAGRRSAPLAEVELELLWGNPEILFEIARILDGTVPLRLSVQSKSDRGYRLAAGTPARAVKAGKIRIGAGHDVEMAFPEIAHDCLRQFRLNEDLLLPSGAPGPLHQARVGIRRLRSAISLFRDVVGEDARTAAIKTGLKTLAGTLGSVRNLDVLAPRIAPSSRDAFSAARDDAVRRAEAALRSDDTRSLMLDIAEWLAIGDWRHRSSRQELLHDDARDFARHVLTVHLKRLKRKGRLLQQLDDDARHKVRIEAKKLRYAAEFFGSLFSEGKRKKRRKHFIDAMKALQNRLGDLNDLVVGPATLDRIGLTDGMREPGKKARRHMLERADQAFERLMETKPFWK